MKIGSQIKSRRQELNMTQEALAKRLNVSRSTVSNWESGRNYPDLQLIVSVSEILDIPLDKLLKKECEIAEEITKDKNTQKSQGQKIKIMKIILILIILTGFFGLYKAFEYRDISSSHQIVSVQVNDKDELEILTDLPFYRSLSASFIGSSPKGNETIEISLTSKIDLSMKHQQRLILKMDSLLNDMEAGKIKKVDVTNSNKIIRTFDIYENSKE